MLADINLGEVLWSLLVLYLILMYLVVVITVILDLIRSDDVSGWAKAMWSIALIALPIVAFAVYLIVRGDGIGMRSLERAQYEPPVGASEIPPPPAPAVVTPASELEKAKQLLDAGVIEPGEFEGLKQKLLA